MITGLDHASIATDKLDATRDFFVEAIGLELGDRPAFRFPGYWLYGGGRPILHLIGEAGGRKPDGALDHVSFGTDDMPAALARLEKAGVAHQHQLIPGGFGSQAFCRDPNGILIEITARA